MSTQLLFNHTVQQTYVTEEPFPCVVLKDKVGRSAPRKY